jgi:hypothetical protein
MTLVAFNSSSLRLRFIFMFLASLMTSLSSFLALLFWSSLFCFCLVLGFCQPYHHLPLASVSISFMVRAILYMLFDAFFTMPYHPFILIIVHDFQHLPAFEEGFSLCDHRPFHSLVPVEWCLFDSLNQLSRQSTSSGNMSVS